MDGSALVECEETECHEEPQTKRFKAEGCVANEAEKASVGESSDDPKPIPGPADRPVFYSEVNLQSIFLQIRDPPRGARGASPSINVGLNGCGKLTFCLFRKGEERNAMPFGIDVTSSWTPPIFNGGPFVKKVEYVRALARVSPEQAAFLKSLSERVLLRVHEQSQRIFGRQVPLEEVRSNFKEIVQYHNGDASVSVRLNLATQEEALESVLTEVHLCETTGEKHVLRGWTALKPYHEKYLSFRGSLARLVVTPMVWSAPQKTACKWGITLRAPQIFIFPSVANASNTLVRAIQDEPWL